MFVGDVFRWNGGWLVVKTELDESIRYQQRDPWVVVFDRGQYINLKQLLYLIALIALKEKGIKLSAHN